MTLNAEFEIDAREVFAALRETKRLPAGLNGAAFDTTDDACTFDFRLPGDDANEPVDRDLLWLTVYTP